MQIFTCSVLRLEMSKFYWMKTGLYLHATLEHCSLIRAASASDSFKRMIVLQSPDLGTQYHKSTLRCRICFISRPTDGTLVWYRDFGHRDLICQPLNLPTWLAGRTWGRSGSLLRVFLSPSSRRSIAMTLPRFVFHPMVEIRLYASTPRCPTLSHPHPSTPDHHRATVPPTSYRPTERIGFEPEIRQILPQFLIPLLTATTVAAAGGWLTVNWSADWTTKTHAIDVDDDEVFRWTTSLLPGSVPGHVTSAPGTATVERYRRYWAAEISRWLRIL